MMMRRDIEPLHSCSVTELLQTTGVPECIGIKEPPPRGGLMEDGLGSLHPKPRGIKLFHIFNDTHSHMQSLHAGGPVGSVEFYVRSSIKGNTPWRRMANRDKVIELHLIALGSWR